MNSVPIIKKGLKLEEAVSGNFEIKDGNFYVKVLSELYAREDEFSLGFIDTKEGVEEACYVARKYQDLVEIGFYPPNTHFIVAKDEVDVITLVSIMPKIDLVGSWYPDLEKEKLALRRKAAKVLGVNEESLWSDTLLDSNYGLLDDQIYFFDLHVLPFYKLLKNGKEYRQVSLA